MKTSNRILLGFLITVFATLVFLFMGFRNKIKKGEYTMTKVEYKNLPYFKGSIKGKKYEGSIKPFTVLKVVGPDVEGVFSCEVLPASSTTYDYSTYDNHGGVKFEQNGDTLLVKYIGNYKGKDRSITGNSFDITFSLRINLHMPIVKSIIVERASIIIDSMGKTGEPEIYFDLSKKATLDLGLSGTATMVPPNSLGMAIKNTANIVDAHSSKVIEKSTGQFNKVFIKASESYIYLGKLAWVNELNLQILGLSKINIDDESRIDQLKGFISDSTKIESNWKNVRWLATLNVN